MLTDLSFLQTGQPWPPKSERARLDTYAANRKLFEAEHAEVFKDSVRRVLRSAEESGLMEAASFELCVNYFRLISVTTAGMLFNRFPALVAGKEQDTEAMDILQSIDDRSDLQEVFYAVALDASRYGDGLLYVRRENGKGVIDIARADCWFPVVDAANIRRVLYHVLATAYRQGDNSFLRAEIHSPGSIEIRDYRMEGASIGQQIGQSIEKTGLDTFSVFPVSNLRPSDRVHGIDDYNDVQSLVCELEVRMAQINRILDKHTNPSMQGPREALTVITDEESGEAREVFIPGGYFVNGNGESTQAISYLTWDAQLSANFEQIKNLERLIRVISEMGALLSDMSDKAGAVPSGAAMRRMLYSTISKISRLRNRFTPAIRKAIQAAAMMSGTPLGDKPIYIKWPDALPRDPQEQAQIAALRTGDKQTQSVKRAIMDLDEIDEDDAEAELEVIREEQASAMPMFDSPNNEDDEDEPDDHKEGV